MKRPARYLQARMWCRNMAYDVSRVQRHTFFIMSVQKGISLPAPQRLLGHDGLTTTEIDLYLSPEEAFHKFREKW
jgi:site-specific recombinase XerD